MAEDPNVQDPDVEQSKVPGSGESGTRVGLADPIVRLSESALEKVLALRADEPDADELGLRLLVAGLSNYGTDYTYDMYFEPVADATDDDIINEQGGLSLLIARADVSKLQGSVLDAPTSPSQTGLTLRNPNKPNPFTGNTAQAPLALEGDAAERVQQVLEHRINPMIAAHGGRAELVAVENSTAYVRLSGGCQGCGMASVTVGQGIESAILSLVPDVTQVIDVTDHASGANPYYEASAK